MGSPIAANAQPRIGDECRRSLNNCPKRVSDEDLSKGVSYGVGYPRVEL